MSQEQMSFSEVSSEFQVKKHVSGLKGPIASFAISKLREGWSAKETVDLVLEAFPNAKTSIKCVYWYASKAGIRLSAKTFDQR